jgi:hypothetical protein
MRIKQERKGRIWYEGRVARMRWQYEGGVLAKRGVPRFHPRQIPSFLLDVSTSQEERHISSKKA